MEDYSFSNATHCDYNWLDFTIYTNYCMDFKTSTILHISCTHVQKSVHTIYILLSSSNSSGIVPEIQSYHMDSLILIEILTKRYFPT